ncbi:Maltooligosyl trehalose synthase [Corynebacterium deserti GIMN1.010]|uniref:Maltooligosyl trehalose synthase n=1 Tax=Corynebacterium deserti GIMN1.010 TaxID=931089 RepID=A0A0M4CMK9_9CORY|nr:malto-oligosyltrehalose synthase [Corynebacterium deserti]ALC06297.1 Maltooligosyl trehalose synthase [Corynebacterium deserti GIMN1.010]
MARPLTATYRLQMRGPQADSSGRAFGFAEAKAQLPYLKKLGISHLYLSPILTSMPDSNHGYDVIDPTSINEELGGMEGFRELAHATHEQGMGIIIDIVPNHLGVAVPHLNPWWWDVLKNGQNSAYEFYFDIDWNDDNGSGGKLGMPILGEEGDEDKLEFDDLNGEKVLRYYENIFPIAPGSEEVTPQATYENQHYRLKFWRDGVINYRRFFSVNTLAGVRQEDPLVFEHTHRVLRELIAEDLIDGVRVDHPDGLSNPFGYLHRLREVIGPDRWLIIEKILGVDEPLDPRLSVDGTTGYDALRELDGVFISRESEDRFSMLALTHSGSTWDDKALRSTEETLKREVAQNELAAEIRRLARAMRRDNFSTAGHNVTEEKLSETIIELVAAMPVYRADYLSLSRTTATVIADMSKRFPSRRDALDLISAALLGNGEAKIRFAQVCGAVMAKGVEDTTFYRASRLVALQEVGGAPGRFGVSAAEFHLLQEERSLLWPRTMTTLSTHDTKRGEDTRARIIELTEIPNDFSELVNRVSAVLPAPDGGTGHFLLQNLLGVWPADGVITDSLRSRFADYALKAVREASTKTTWVDPNESFEASLCDWVEALFDGPSTSLITDFVQRLHRGSVQISLGRKLLQMVGAGIPDTYQGTEFLEDSLVDPDNRRFVDYTAREQLLDTLDNWSWEDAGPLTENADLAKLAVVHKSLEVRAEFPDCFVDGNYQAVFGEGRAESHIVGTARGTDRHHLSIIALATRRPLILEDRGGWHDTTVTLPKGTWEDRLTGKRYSGVVPATDVFEHLPVALLVLLVESEI